MDSASDKRKLQNLFRYHFGQRSNIKLPLKDIKAVDAIMQCRTVARGYNLLSCDDAHEMVVQPHSCRHRSCPICADRSRYQWIEKEKKRLLNCSHYHVIFTLPHEYLNLWEYNRKWFTQHLFKAARDTLIELLEDKRYLGATPGILMTLHTWGRQLNYHPHIHCLVSGGGLGRRDEWKAVRKGYLLPIRVVKSLYRGKLQYWIKEALKQGILKIPSHTSLSEWIRTHRETYQKQWSVRIQEEYEHGKGVALYLARYMKGGPIDPSRLRIKGEEVEFNYLDHRDKRIKTCRMTIALFIKRLLWHVPENGIHVVRHYGLYASKNLKRKEACALRYGFESKDKNDGTEIKDGLNWSCRICGALLKRRYSSYPGQGYENSIIRSRAVQIVQQCVEVERETVASHHRRRKSTDSCYFFDPTLPT
jgi:hypothetical protein